MKLYLKRGVMGGFIITLATIGGLGIYAYLSTRSLIAGASLLEQNLLLGSSAERVLVTMIDLETGQGGYVITGEDKYLEPYFSALKTVDGDVDRLFNLTAHSPAQRERAVKLKELVKEKMNIVTLTVEKRRVSFDEAKAVVLSGEGKRLMDAIRTEVRQIQLISQGFYRGQTSESNAVLATFQVAFIAMLIVPVAIIVFLFYNINAHLTRQEKANLEIARASTEISQLNRELEDFTYSVSHDLRAPLRSVNGYSQVLKEDYGQLLDTEARRIIEVIAANGRRMGKLIDNLLDFSRLGRKEVVKTNVAVNVLVEAVIAELGEEQPALSNAKIVVGDLPPALADKSMIKQVWEHLLSNALKYSSRRETPVIEVGSCLVNGETCYFVKDNGVGFNMDYVGKLFGVFQSLHKANEFEGTGVGLALSKRIVDKHGGKIWAEAVLDEGATFFFILPT